MVGNFEPNQEVITIFRIFCSFAQLSISDESFYLFVTGVSKFRHMGETQPTAHFWCGPNTKNDFVH
jgi:hypothetical protein